MYTFKSIIRLLVLLSVVSFPMKPAEATTMLDNNNGPELPPACSTITAPEGHKLAFHVYAKGVQVYRFNGIRRVYRGRDLQRDLRPLPECA